MTKRLIFIVLLISAVAQPVHGQISTPTTESTPPCVDCFSITGFQISEENDSIPFGSGDNDYTQGIRVSQLVNPEWVGKHIRLSGYYPSLSFTVGQNLYTPQILTTRQPFPGDRGYAAFNYVGTEVSITAADGSSRHALETSVGILGQTSLSRNAQGGLHALQMKKIPKGWDSLDTKYGFYTRYAYEKAFDLLHGRIFEKKNGKLTFKRTGPTILDVVPMLPAIEMGSARVSAAAGAMLRLGYNITGFPVGSIPAARLQMSDSEARRKAIKAVDEAPGAAVANEVERSSRIEAAVKNLVKDRNEARDKSDWELAGQFGYYARAVGVTELVTGTSVGVRPNTVVTDASGGIYLRCGPVRVSLLRVRRSPEYHVDGVDADTQKFTTMSLSYLPLSGMGGCGWLGPRGTGDSVASDMARWISSGWGGQLGMGTSFARENFSQPFDPTIVGHFSIRKHVAQGFAAGFERSAIALNEGTPSLDGRSTRDMLIRQTLGTVGWGRDFKRIGSFDFRLGIPKTTQMKLQTYEHEFGPGGATRLGPFDSDEVETTSKGWMVGGQYLLPLADQLKVGFDVSRHALGEAGGRFAGNPTWWKFAIFVELGNSRRGAEQEGGDQTPRQE